MERRPVLRCCRPRDLRPPLRRAAAAAAGSQALIADALSRAEGGGLAAGTPLERLLSADAVWASPLTRALQTCLVGLKPLLLAQGLSVQLRKNAREPHHIADLNSRGVAVGAAALMRRASEKLREVVGEARAHAAELAELEGVPLESVEVEEEWWEEGSSETSAQLRRRLHELMRQVQYSPYERIVLVTHGSVIAELLSLHQPSGGAVVRERAALESGSPLEEVLGGPPHEGKVESCAIVCCKLDFRRASRLIAECCVIKPAHLAAAADDGGRPGGRGRAQSIDSEALPSPPETPSGGVAPDGGPRAVRQAPIWRPNILRS